MPVYHFNNVSAFLEHYDIDSSNYWADDLTYNINTFLEHHGIKGQKWGIRRTLEQLGHVARKVKKKVKSSITAAKKAKKKRDIERKEKLEKQVAEEKEKMVKSGKWDKVYKNKELFTDKELEDIKKRIQLEENVKKMVDNESDTPTQNTSPKEKAKGLAFLKEKVDNALPYIDTALNAYDKINRVRKVIEGEQDRRRSDIVNSGDLQLVYNNRSDLSTQQLRDALARNKELQKVATAVNEAAKQVALQQQQQQVNNPKQSNKKTKQKHGGRKK